MDVRFTAAGLVVGTFVGLSGVGGSAILAPLLILFLGVKPSIAVGTDLLYSVPTKILALALHARNRTVDWGVTGFLLLGGVPGALAGLGAFANLRARMPEAKLEAILRHGIGVAILLACVGVVATWIARGRRATPAAAELTAPFRPAVVAIGAIVGFLVALTSVGSGSVTLPLLLFALPGLAIRRLIGSEIAFAAFLVPLAAAGHASFGNVSWGIVLALVVGALPGVYLGSRLVVLGGEGWLRPVVVGVLAFAGSRLV